MVLRRLHRDLLQAPWCKGAAMTVLGQSGALEVAKTTSSVYSSSCYKQTDEGAAVVLTNMRLRSRVAIVIEVGSCPRLATPFACLYHILLVLLGLREFRAQLVLLGIWEQTQVPSPDYDLDDISELYIPLGLVNLTKYKCSGVIEPSCLNCFLISSVLAEVETSRSA